MDMKKRTSEIMKGEFARKIVDYIEMFNTSL